ncbi:MAG: hypothetical protein IJT13_01485 [Bacteroidaceae bacterium]|nr:hypothetical protein [Bacteroidaceae bacterium]
MKVLDALMGMIIGMQTSIKLIEEKIDSMRGSEESVFDPNAGNDTIPLQQGTEITQDGDGVIE